MRERFEIRRYREEVLITGVRSARVIGRLLVTSRQGEFHTYDRELLDRFADYCGSGSSTSTASGSR